MTLKNRQRLCVFLLVAVLTTLVGFDTAWGISLTHDVKITLEGSGSLYFSPGPRLEACHTDSHKTFNPACRVESGKKYSVSVISDSGIIVCPDEDSTFDGFYSSSGKKVSLKAVKMDILRVKIGGEYVYTHYPSLGSGSASALTKPVYAELVKQYVKALYNTSRYSVKGQETVYLLPSGKVNLTARFSKKPVPSLAAEQVVRKNFGDADFSVINKLPSGLSIKCTSSNSKVISVGKTNGIASVKGTGIAKVTLSSPATEIYQSSQERIKVYVCPAPVTGLSATKKSSNIIDVIWDSSTLCSGYDIEFSINQSFTKVFAKYRCAKSASSSKACKINAADYKNCRYARIRGYKKSCGETLYSDYSTVRIR